MENKINLDEIIDINLSSEGRRWLDRTSNIREVDVKRIMIEFGKQLLKLAANNAKIIEDPNSYCGNTGSEYPPDKIVSKQSILDTINQIE
jgi:hypothetical protein